MMRVPKLIDGIDFGLMSPDEIRRISVTKIVAADTYDDDGYPIDRGLMDSRLGVVDPGLRCRTCAGRSGACPGHFGHVELSRPVIHVGYVDNIYDCLRAICKNKDCGRIHLSEQKIENFRNMMEESKKSGGKWWEISNQVIKSANAVEKCPHCREKKRCIPSYP